MSKQKTQLQEFQEGQLPQDFEAQVKSSFPLKRNRSPSPKSKSNGSDSDEVVFVTIAESPKEKKKEKEKKQKQKGDKVTITKDGVKKMPPKQFIRQVKQDKQRKYGDVQDSQTANQYQPQRNNYTFQQAQPIGGYPQQSNQNSNQYQPQAQRQQQNYQKQMSYPSNSPNSPQMAEQFKRYPFHNAASHPTPSSNINRNLMMNSNVNTNMNINTNSNFHSPPNYHQNPNFGHNVSPHPNYYQHNPNIPPNYSTPNFQSNNPPSVYAPNNNFPNNYNPNLHHQNSYGNPNFANQSNPNLNQNPHMNLNTNMSHSSSSYAQNPQPRINPNSTPHHQQNYPPHYYQSNHQQMNPNLQIQSPQNIPGTLNPKTGNTNTQFPQYQNVQLQSPSPESIAAQKQLNNRAQFNRIIDEFSNKQELVKRIMSLVKQITDENIDYIIDSCKDESQIKKVFEALTILNLTQVIKKIKQKRLQTRLFSDVKETVQKFLQKAQESKRRDPRLKA